jgi:predicted HicB family RNase H-like nuclease
MKAKKPSRFARCVTSHPEEFLGVRIETDNQDEGEARMKKTDTSKRVKVAKWKQLTVRVPPEVHRALRIKAVEEGRSCAVIVEGLVRQYLVGGKPA